MATPDIPVPDPAATHRATPGGGARTDRPDVGGDAGFSTAELLANAAFAIVALFAIWQALEALGVNVISQIGAQLSGGL